MSWLDIDTSTDDGTVPFWTQTTSLSGNPYTLGFAWNSRGEYWALSVSAPDGTLLIAGQVVNIGRDFLANCTSVLKPAGPIVASREDGSVELPGLGELGSIVTIKYWDPSS